MRSRGPINPGPAALLLAVVLATPEILKRCKPFAKSLGDLLVKAGEQVHKMAEDEPVIVPETSGTDEPSDAPNDVVKEAPKEVAGEEIKEQLAEDLAEREAAPEISVDPVEPETVSPTGHDEQESHEAAEAKGDGAAPEPVVPVPHTEDEKTDDENPKDPE